MPGTNLGTAFVQIVPSAQGISGAIQNVMNGEASAAGDSAGKTIASKIKGAIVAAGIGTAVVAGLKKSLTEGANLEQAIGGIETIFEGAEDKMLDYASNAYKAAGISANQYMEQATSFGASLLQATGGDSAKAADAANQAIIDMADNANKMGTPLQSIQDAYQGFAKQNYTMLDNLKLGYGGTKTEMERLLAHAQELTGQEYDIDNLEDVYEAIHAVQDELGITGTTAEEAASTFSGSFASMRAAYDDLMGNMMLGENVGPAMQNLAETASTFLFQNLIPALGNIFSSLPTAISTFIQTGLPQFMAAGTQLVTTLANGAKTALPGMIKTLMTGLVNVSGQLRTGFSKFVDVGLGLIKSIADGIIKNIPTFIQTVPKIITNIAGLINDNAPKLLATGFSIIKSLALGLIKAIPVLVENIPQIAKAIFAVFTAIQWANLGKIAVKGIASGLKAMGKYIKSSANSIKDKIVAPIKAIPGRISGAIASIKSKLSFSGLKAKVAAVFNGIKDAIKDKLDTAKQKVKDMIDKIKNMFPFSVGKIFSGKIKLPKISVKKTSDGGAKAESSTSEKTFAKAMNNPYMFGQKTVFAAGEAGDEMLYGHRSLMSDISEAVEAHSSGGDIIINLNYDATDDAADMLRDLARGVKRYRMAGAF